MIRLIGMLSAGLSLAAVADEELLRAAYQSDVPALRTRLEAGADAKEANRYSVTPLSVACLNGDAEVVKLLLDAGADSNGETAGGVTALMTASRTGNVECVKLLLAAGAKVDAKERRGQTALMWAAAEGNVETVRELLDKGADFQSTLKSGFSPLLFAVRAGHSDVVRVLVKAGADVTQAAKVKGKDARGMRDGTSPLMLAVENGNLELALELVDLGADPNDMRSGFAPLHAISWVRKAVSGDGVDGIPVPRITGTVDTLEFVRQLVKRGADVNLRQTAGGGGGENLELKGATPFFMAAGTDDLPLLKTLKELGADEAIPNHRGTTPLMAAAGVGIGAPGEDAGSEGDALETMAWLLDLGADIDAVDQRDETAMHGAAYKGVGKVVHLLDQRGADIAVWNRKNKNGWTPLLIAQGFRFGNFRPIVETQQALGEVMKAHGVEPPPPPKRDPES